MRRLASSASQPVRPALAASLAFWLLLVLGASERCSADEQAMGPGVGAGGAGVLPLQHHASDKRAAAAPLYGFGLGKRSPLLMMADESPVEPDIDEDEEDDAMVAEASRGYLEKRGPREPLRYGFGLGKRRGGHEREYAPFDQEKRERHRFSFGLGKRDKKSKLEDFMKRRYNFGLGKRGIYGGDVDAGERWKRSSN
uniref:Putative allatostatin a preprohormone mori allatostatin preprohormone n=1 Tax=Amblyomma cajennense TaxID=34607 RepID=A0A023FCW2_AMBCJ